MRMRVVGLAVVLGIAAPQIALAASGPAAAAAESATGGPLRMLVERLDLHLFARAHAAECKEEGEVCKTSVECCSGLECSGDPQPTCRPPE